MHIFLYLCAVVSIPFWWYLIPLFNGGSHDHFLQRWFDYTNNYSLKHKLFK